MAVYRLKSKQTFLVPLHKLPSNWKPRLHPHINEPGVFVQAEFVGQLLVPSEHSLISKIDKN